MKLNNLQKQNWNPNKKKLCIWFMEDWGPFMIILKQLSKIKDIIPRIIYIMISNIKNLTINK